ncbi:MAG: 16S rRNA (cytidine(1402)-2'-O)-methyltransferase, partial [Betaproteobacteria bacterium]|nr:16S rRNA (cytidine(1402)-2'-O)-methyltransferase [Betaproteobacteria bacterium]
ALHVLQLVDTVACEDTRHSQALLRAFGIDHPAEAWLAVHQHNESASSEAVLARLKQGQRVAFVSDAGTPAISDPGARLVARVQAEGVRVVPLPGASSVTALLSVSGQWEDTQPGFVFVGFLSSRAQERQAQVTHIAQESRAQVLLEAPHRIEALAQALLPLGQRRITVGRELTKQFEEIATVSADALTAWLQDSSHRTRGEFALVVHPQAAATPNAAADDRVLRLLLNELPVKTAVRLASEITGQARNALYEQALRLRAPVDTPEED